MELAVGGSGRFSGGVADGKRQRESLRRDGRACESQAQPVTVTLPVPAPAHLSSGPAELSDTWRHPRTWKVTQPALREAMVWGSGLPAESQSSLPESARNCADRRLWHSRVRGLGWGRSRIPW